jgi:hypothetical protein
MPKRKFTDEQEKEICKQYNEDKLSSITLSKIWNCDISTVVLILSRYGYHLRSRSEAQIVKLNKMFTEFQEQQICNEYFSKEKPSTTILAKKWGCSYSTIGEIVRRNGYKLRTKSEIMKDPKIREKISKALQGENSPMYGTHLSDASKKKIRDKKIGIPRSEETKKKMSDTKKTFTKEKEQQICKEYFSEDKPSADTLSKKWNCSPCVIRDAIKRCGFSLRTKYEVVQTKEARKRKSIQLQKIMKDPKIKEKISKARNTPEAIQQSLKNGFGSKCYYDNEFFPSLSERDCYIELKKLGFKIDHNFRGRFDFLVNDKIVVEFHSFDFKLTDEQYYLQRRKLLDEYGYKDLKLIVIKDLKEIENNLNNI